MCLWWQVVFVAHGGVLAFPVADNATITNTTVTTTLPRTTKEHTNIGLAMVPPANGTGTSLANPVEEPLTPSTEAPGQISPPVTIIAKLATRTTILMPTPFSTTVLRSRPVHNRIKSNISSQDVADQCYTWLQKEIPDKDWQREVNDKYKCPCHEDQITNVFSRETWWLRELSKYLPGFLDFSLGKYHPGAKMCYRAGPTANGHGQQCCYDAAGAHINSGPGAGTMDRAFPLRRNLYKKHEELDVQPWIWCGRAAGWKDYTKARPIAPCVDVSSPTPVPTPPPTWAPRRRRTRRRRTRRRMNWSPRRRRTDVRRRSYCFHVNSSTRLQGGSLRTISNLVYGDSLETFTGRQRFAVTTFLMDFHAQNAAVATFLRVDHEMGSLLVTPEHLIFVFDSEHLTSKPAGYLHIGDKLVARVTNQMTLKSRVLAIKSEIHAGISAPLTFSGTLFVDDIAVSSYGIQHDTDTYTKIVAHKWASSLARHAHDISHFTMWPLRVSYLAGGHHLICNMAPSWCQEKNIYLGDQRMHWSVGIAKCVFDAVVLQPILALTSESGV